MLISHPIRLALLFGGRSSEYEVSLRSAATVIRGLRSPQYRLVFIGITREGQWKLFEGDPSSIPEDTWDLPQQTAPVAFFPARPEGSLWVERSSGWEPLGVDVAFPVLHGRNGEDGTVQGLFSLCRIPCVGCGTAASAACMDKALTHRVLDGAGIPNAPWEVVYREETADFPLLEQRLAGRLGYPMFVKPANAGSSVGVTKAVDRETLRKGLELALSHDRKAVIEATIVGKEVECAVLGNRRLTVSMPGEIRSAHEVYDYEAKYADIGSETLIPARIPAASLERIRELAAKAYQALLCDGMARVDFFVLEDGSVVLNEVNTLPGFTSISMYPMLMEAAGIPLDQLCHRLVSLALEEAEQNGIPDSRPLA